MDAAEQLYLRLNTVSSLAGDILLDDRLQLTIGRRVAHAKKLGLPHIVALGKQVLTLTCTFNCCKFDCFTS